jgi:uncharacterized SAM-binding protein YcdF (DUF218 family)
MRRAVLLMNRAGAQPVPAPTDQETGARTTWSDWLPSARGLRHVETALHEYLGLAAIALSLD